MAVRTRKRLGDILIEANVITQEQLMQALAKQKEIGKRLGETLIEMKLTDEMEIAEAIGQQMKLKIAKIREAKLARQCERQYLPAVWSGYHKSNIAGLRGKRWDEIGRICWKAGDFQRNKKLYVLLHQWPVYQKSDRHESN